MLQLPRKAARTAAALIVLLLAVANRPSHTHPGQQDGLPGSKATTCPPGDRSCFKLACPPGQGRRSPNEPCALCPYGFFNPGGVYGPCLRCPDNSVTISPGATTCGCEPGTGTLTVDEGPCRPCPTGTYAAGGSMSPCVRCPGSGFMVTPRRATRVTQCTCQPGYGATLNFPTSCQMCPIGTYANALAQISDIPGVPPQGGKGVTRGLWGATVLPCTPCCPGGVGTCSYTTRRPGSTSFDDCVLVPPRDPNATMCCGVPSCPTEVPVPPKQLPSNVRSADAMQRLLQQYAGAQVTLVMPRRVLPPVEGRGRERWPGDSHDRDDGDEDWISSRGGGRWGRISARLDNSDPAIAEGANSTVPEGANSTVPAGAGPDSAHRAEEPGSGTAESSNSSLAAAGSSDGNEDDAADDDDAGGIRSSGGLAEDDSPASSLDDAGSSSSLQDGETGGSAAGAHSSASLQQQFPPPRRSARRGGVGALSACSANARESVASPAGSIAANTPMVITYWADKTAGTTCAYTPTGTLAVGACTGNQIAPYLVLTAAHCVDPAGMREQTDCPNIQLVAVVACYGYNRAAGATPSCPSTAVSIQSVGVSWFDRQVATDRADQAIIFLGQSRGEPYYQYNYIENIPNAFTSTANTFQSLSYSGDGDASSSPPSCGCKACSSMPCGIARSGPANGPLTTDTNEVGNGAVNAQLEACMGSSGNCMSINGQACCVAVDSYEYSASSTDACASGCSNYWSSITAAQPLSILWQRIQYPLPQ